jgi:pimeloyl-ACP methyl ester carboxylesterase
MLRSIVPAVDRWALAALVMTAADSSGPTGDEIAMSEELLELVVADEVQGQATLTVRLEETATGDGRRPMVLYLHGLGSDQWGEKASFFRRRAVEEGLGFCSFDFRGHGRSGGRIEDLTLSRHLADVERAADLLATRGHERYIVMGSSMGGLTGLWHAALNPSRVLAGLFIAPALSLESTLRDRAGDEGMERWRQRGSMRVESEAGSWDLGWSFVSDLQNYPADRLRELYRTPCLILQGTRDDRVAWREVAEFVAECGSSDLELHLFGDGDHRLVDRKQRLWCLMRGYLGSRQIIPLDDG